MDARVDYVILRVEIPVPRDVYDRDRETLISRAESIAPYVTDPINPLTTRDQKRHLELVDKWMAEAVTYLDGLRSLLMQVPPKQRPEGSAAFLKKARSFQTYTQRLLAKRR